MAFKISKTLIPEVIIIEPKIIEDDRGFFMETYKHSEFESLGIKSTFFQDNHSKSKKGVLRGMHYQKPPKGQAKLVRVLSGEIFDVAVDLRNNSPTYKKWVGVKLSESNKKMLFIPEWCAHGFLVLSTTAEVTYKTTSEYSPNHETGIAWNDSSIGITWPSTVSYVSEKDKQWPILEN